jgi:hypothetical protein
MSARDDSDRFRACPKGLRRGIDVARMYPEIRALVVAKFGQAGVDVEDLVQEVAAAIAVKNTSARSAFDPARSGFGHYVYLVARSKLGHMLGSDVRRARPVVCVEEEALAAAAGGEPDSEASPVQASAETVGELVEQLGDLARQAGAAALARRRADDGLEAARIEGMGEGLRAAAELLGAAFAAETPTAQASPPAPPAPASSCSTSTLAERLIALLTIADEPLTIGLLSIGLLSPTADVEAALEQLGERVTRRGRGRWRTTYVLASFSEPARKKKSRKAEALAAAEPAVVADSVAAPTPPAACYRCAHLGFAGMLATTTAEGFDGQVREVCQDCADDHARAVDLAARDRAQANRAAEVRGTLGASLERWRAAEARRGERLRSSRRLAVFVPELLTASTTTEGGTWVLHGPEHRPLWALAKADREIFERLLGACVNVLEAQGIKRNHALGSDFPFHPTPPSHPVDCCRARGWDSWPGDPGRPAGFRDTS